MNVTTKDLIDAAQKALDNHAAAKARYEAAQKRWLVADTAGRKLKALRQQKALRDGLSAAIKKGHPLTAAELKAFVDPPSDRYSSGYITSVAFDQQAETPRRFKLEDVTYEAPGGIPKADLESLIALLSSVQEETISDGQLQRLGFKNLGWVFRAAVANA